MAENNSNFIIGFICQSKVSKDPTMIHITPGFCIKSSIFFKYLTICYLLGVQINETLDGLGQQYTTPENAIFDKKCDIIIVGRGILNAQDQIKTAINYRNLAYNAYLNRLKVTSAN